MKEGDVGDVGGEGGGVEVESFGLPAGVGDGGGVAFGADGFDPDQEADEEDGDGYLLVEGEGEEIGCLVYEIWLGLLIYKGIM